MLAGTQVELATTDTDLTQTVYAHGNGEQVEAIREGKTISLVGKTQGEGASYLNHEESKISK